MYLLRYTASDIFEKNNEMMKQDIKNNELRERQAYVPANMKVIGVTVHGVLCASGSNEDYTNNNPDWFSNL